MHEYIYKKLHLGIGTYTFPWAISASGLLPAPMGALNLLEKAEHFQIGRVQFGDNLPMHRLDSAEIRVMAEKMEESGIRVQTGTRRLTEVNLKRYLQLAVQFRSPFVRMVIDDAGFHPSESEVIRTIKSVLPDFRKAKVVLAIENHDRFPAKSLERIIRQTDEDFVGICLDTANSLGAGEGITEIVSVLAPYTVNLHVKDFIIRRVSHKMGFTVEGCPAGKGMLDIPWLIQEVGKFGRCDTATLEVWSSPEATIEKTLEKEKNWVDESVDYLKTVLKNDT